MKSNLHFFSVIALCFLLVNEAFGQVDDCFADMGLPNDPDANTILSNIRGVQSVHVADMDGDGDKDYVVAAVESGVVAWYENTGNGGLGFTVLDSNTIEKNLPFVWTVYAIDLDGDGDNDVISGTTSKLSLYKNNGLGRFSNPIIISSNQVRSVFSIDINGDGFYDIVSASSSDNRIDWYQNDGIGNFTSANPITNNVDGPRSVYSADLDGDGDNDIVSASALDDKIAWYRNDGQGNFTETLITTSADNAYDVFAIDIDGDGDNDVLSASNGDGTVAWYANDGQGNFGGANFIDTSNSSVRTIYSADIDGDGNNDVIAGGASYNVVWYENQGGGSFSNRIPISNSSTIGLPGAGTFDVIAADMDNDGDNDIAAAVKTNFNKDLVYFQNECPPIPVPGCTNPCATNYNPDATEFDGSCVFDPPIDDGCALTTDSIDQATCEVVNTPPDVNDGCPNTDDSFDATTCEILNISNCSAGTTLDENCNCVSEEMACFDGNWNNILPQSTVSSNASYNFDIIDFDGDGDLDVVSISLSEVTGSVGGIIILHQNDGMGNFIDIILLNTSTVGEGYSAVSVVDIDNDGDLDILYSDSFPFFSRIFLLMNDGMGNFLETQVTNHDLMGNDGFEIADSDSDGDMDFIYVAVDNNFSVLYIGVNDGLGNFTINTVDFLGFTGSDVADISTEDVDNDGDIDIIVGYDRLVWYQNDGLGNFTRIVIDNSVPTLRKVYSTDLDSDGDIDVVVTTNSNLRFYENDGAENFIESFLLAGSTTFLNFADFNSDGFVDIILGGGGLSLYENDGSLNFTGTSIFTDNGSYPIVADLDLDDDLDILTVGSGLGWYENDCEAQSTSGCTNPCATNYNPDVTEDDGSCTLPSADDGCDLTTDSIDPTTCAVVNTPPNPDDGCALTTDSFDVANCMIINMPPDVDDGCDFTTDSFDAANCVIVNTSPNPDDGCALTTDSFDVANCMIINMPPNVDDGCDLTMDIFDVATCAIINNPPNVDDGCTNTNDSFDATTCTILNG